MVPGSNPTETALVEFVIAQVSPECRRIGRILGHRDQKIVKLPAGPMLVAGGLCERVCRPLGISPPIYRRRVDFFTKSRAFDISRARAEIGYAPQVGLREGIRKTLTWYKERGWL